MAHGIPGHNCFALCKMDLLRNGFFLQALGPQKSRWCLTTYAMTSETSVLKTEFDWLNMSVRKPWPNGRG